MSKYAGCKGCTYYREMHSLGVFACHYALDNDVCRLVPVENCPFYSKKKHERKKRHMNPPKRPRTQWTPELLAELTRLDRLDIGPTEIAERLGIDRKAVQNKLERTRKQDKPAALTVAETQNAALNEVMSKVITLEPAEPPKLIEAAEPADDLDPLIYEAFDRAVAMAYTKHIQVRHCWRQLLAASEKHIRRLADYAAVSESAYESTVNLAAIAAAAEMEEVA